MVAHQAVQAFKALAHVDCLHGYKDLCGGPWSKHRLYALRLLDGTQQLRQFAFGEFLLMSRFNLLAGTVADGVDPSLPESAWALSPLGWFLVLLPFIALVVGIVVGALNKKENANLTKDILG